MTEQDWLALGSNPFRDVNDRVDPLAGFNRGFFLNAKDQTGRCENSSSPRGNC
jgi:hypothetical protein